ncbi:hypothetical protein UPYG_G00238750 [Umbra pygmaea]|uniref:USP domain-containing protein n=1 Tax=Umbra pygmaea TaxID=75934 RepID=A0ABD0WEV8_UMBPY
MAIILEWDVQEAHMGVIVRSFERPGDVNMSSQKCKYNGLRNQGATCYLNSVLQVLFMTEEFRTTIESHEICEETETFDGELKKLFHDLENGNANTKTILLKLGSENAYKQRDAAEYFVKILNMVSEDASKIFKLQLSYTTTCSDSELHKTTYEPDSFWTLPISLNVPSESDKICVKNSIDEFFKPSQLGGEMLYCDKCKRKSKATMVFEIVNHPKILTVQLERSEFIESTTRLQIEIPHYLQIKTFDYELFAIVDHIGDLTGGHYTARIKLNKDQWYRFNDTIVEPVDITTKSPITTRSAYLLMYKNFGDKKTEEYTENNMNNEINKDENRHKQDKRKEVQKRKETE